MSNIISMINWKGGVGKSTLSLHLGVNIMRQIESRPRVLLIDLDPQCNLSYLALGVSKYTELVYDKKKPPSRIFLTHTLKEKRSILVMQ